MTTTTTYCFYSFASKELIQDALKETELNHQQRRALAHRLFGKVWTDYEIENALEAVSTQDLHVTEVHDLADRLLKVAERTNFCGEEIQNRGE